MSHLPFWYQNAYKLLLDLMPKDRRVRWMELGVYEGAGICYLVREARRLGVDLVANAVDSFVGINGGSTLDPDLRLRYQANISHAVFETKIAVHTLVSDTLQASNIFADASFDVVWLDSDHSARHVSYEIAAWWPKVRPGGWIGGDDWDFQQPGDPSGHGVQAAVRSQFRPDEILLGTGDREGQPWRWWLVRKASV